MHPVPGARHFILAVSFCGVNAIAAAAQSADSTSAPPTTKVWLSLSLGPARTEQTGQGLVAGQIALWGSRDRWAMAIRRSGGSDLDTRDEYDTALLFGLRTTPGPAIVTNDPAGGPRSSAVGVGVAAELSLNLKYIGLGVSGFGALGSGHRFAGVGVTAELGVIR
jgi:hypothetical protein